MSLRVGDLVTVADDAEFRNDVQLSDYRQPQNVALARDYIFTSKAASGKKSSAEILRLLCEAYLPGQHPNRFVVIATYGHGKSHFGVALANYFGKPVGSAEHAAVLSRLKDALVHDQGAYGFLERFRIDRKPFLVLILRGDEPSDLSTKFYRAVEEALAEYHDSGGPQITTPFWHTGAARFLSHIPDQLRDKANAFLDTHGLDLEILRTRVERQETSAHAICRELHQHLYGTAPHFSEFYSLKEAVGWLARDLCGHGDSKPFSGVLILFDEFTAFIRNYVQQMRSHVGTPLQDLLNGVESELGRVAFVAFAQADPVATVQHLLQYGIGDTIENLRKELERLPMAQRYILHSSLESVLDAYLRQDEETWYALQRESSTFAYNVNTASKVTFEIFERRYAEELGWELERFRDVVTKGCFPLHPVTTALLCSVDLEVTPNPRSVLGFVFQQLDTLREKPLVDDSKLAWVLPIKLVDYFGEMLGQEAWRTYRQALDQAGGPDASDTEQSVLKAMLLQTVGHVRTSRLGYDTAIGHMAGLTRLEASQALEKLAERGIIRYDSVSKVYTFWPAGKGAWQVEVELAKVLANEHLNENVLKDVTARLSEKDSPLAPVPVAVEWGHQQDWQAVNMLATREMLSAKYLSELAERHLHHGLSGDAQRGLAVWLLTQRDDDVEWFRSNIGALVAEAFPSTPVPMVLLVPTVSNVELCKYLLKFYGLARLSQSVVGELGWDAINYVRDDCRAKLRTEFARVLETARLEVPPAFRARIHSQRLRRLEDVLREIYEMAYAQGPRKWFTQYRASQSKLVNAVRHVYSLLLDNKLSGPALTDAVAKDIVRLYLQQQWKLVQIDYRVSPPEADAAVLAGWQALEDHFRPMAGPRRVGEILTKLLNVPYGYDENTVTLLFAAWFGYWQHDLEVTSSNGRLARIRDLIIDRRGGTMKPKDLLPALEAVALTRTDPGELRSKVVELLKRVDRDTFSQEQAREAITFLKDFLDKGRGESLANAITARDKLTEALRAAEEYDRQVGQILEEVQREHTIGRLVEHLKRVLRLPVVSRVQAVQPKPNDVDAIIRRRIDQVTNEQCNSLSRLDDIGRYEYQRQVLQQAADALRRADLLPLYAKVKDALQKLDAARTDAEVGSKIDALPVKGPLTELRAGAAQLRERTFQSPTLQERASRKLVQVEKEIQRLTDFATRLSSRLDALIEPQAVRFLREEILREQRLFDGTDEAELVGQTLARCTVLENCFNELSRLAQIQPTTPEELTEAMCCLQTLLTQHRSSLSGVQVGAIQRRIADLQAIGQEQQQQALAWLERCEREVEQEHLPADLPTRLQSVPAFLPVEALPRLQVVRERVQQRMDEDRVLQIKVYVQGITDPKRRTEFIARLERLIEELRSV